MKSREGRAAPAYRQGAARGAAPAAAEDPLWDLPPLKRRAGSRAASALPPGPPRPITREERERRAAALARKEEAVRLALAEVLRDVRRLESETRRGGAASAQRQRLRELRVRESRLHAELGEARRQLAEVRASLAAH